MKKAAALLSALLLLLPSGCEFNRPQGVCHSGGDVSLAYFPPLSFSADAAENRTITLFYSRLLSSLEEPAVYSLKKGEMVRLLYLDNHQPPKSFRIQQQADSYQLIVSELANFQPETRSGILNRKKRLLTVAEAGEFHKLLAKLPGAQRDNGTARPVANELKWILEAYVDKHYRLIDQAHPAAAQLQELTNFLLNLAADKQAKNY